MENMTLLIDIEKRDLVFDENGDFIRIFDCDTIVQNVRHTLLTWKSEFFADNIHGTDYERILGVTQNNIDDDEIKEIIREAVFQESSVSRIDSIEVSHENRVIAVMLSATLADGKTIALEVTA